MALLPKGFLSQKVSDLRSKLGFAFSTEPAEPLSSADLALLERAADVIIQRGMATPAMIFLESVGPMHFLGSQALHFFTPILHIVFPERDVQRIALLLERRDSVSRLITLIEAREQGPRR